MPTRAKAEQRRRDERLEAADADDVETMLELLGDQADGVLKMLRRWQRRAGIRRRT